MRTIAFVKTLITNAALADLRQIQDWIAADNPKRAVSFTEELLSKAQSISRNPRLYPLVPRYEAIGIRRRVYKDYLIFFRLRSDSVEVIHIVHGARDYGVLLGDPG